MALQKYARQKGLSCTPCAIMYSLCVLIKQLQPICGQEVMEIIMQTASELYEDLKTQTGETILQQHEVLQNLKMTEFVQHEEIYFYGQANTENDLPGCFHIDKLFDMIKNESAMILTSSVTHHTTALIKRHDVLYFFDPLVASVEEIDTAKTLKAKLCTRHDTEVFTATRIHTVTQNKL